ncbi:hypothetical protein [Algoriphagus limi]|uniref:Uncharacterized protein n=1 Tax=Algoriphagus limi TaxID=2975273 RepID=A0ABT2G3Z7_9BACT|nr:hypothetical protein [Algoriphagus limi]MCS5489988.1 hypothetical protein [Algoriphagus limi]
MKKISLLFISFFLLGGIALAQDINDEITLIQAEFGMEKRQIVEAVMELPEPLTQGFWFVYQQYEAERQLLARERILIIEDYLDKYDVIDDEIANSLALSTLKNDAALSKLHSKYYKKLKKATTAKYAAKFFQLDTYIHNTIRNSIQQELPFIGEF